MEVQGHVGGDPARPPSATAVRLEGDIQGHIGRQLRAVYDEVANQPVPEKLLKLMEELDRQASAVQKKDEA